jgi:hypothetical protein
MGDLIMACAIRYHADVNFTAPNGHLDMAQTFSYRNREEADGEAESIKKALMKSGATDIKIYVREIRCFVDEKGDVL